MGIRDAVGDVIRAASSLRVSALGAENVGFGLGFRGGVEMGSGS